MRIAFVVGRLPMRRELATSVVDAEGLAALADGHDVFLFVDELGEGVDVAREAGVVVDVSPKRVVDLHGRITADEAVARGLASIHATAPLDAIVVSPEIASDPAWYVPELGDVPLGVVSGDAMQRYARLALDDPGHRDALLMGQWAAAGCLRGVDFLVGNAPPSSFGFNDPAPPPLLSWAPVVQPGPAPAGPPRSLVVLATVADRTELAASVFRAWSAIPVDERTTTVVVVPDLDLTGEAPGDLVRAGVDAEGRASVVVVPEGSDGVGHSFLAEADAVALLGPAEASIPALSDLAPDIPVVLLSGSVPQPRPIDHLAEAVRPESPSRVVLTGSMPDIAMGMDRVDADVVIIHDDRGGDQAARLFSTPRLSPHAVTVLARPGPVHGAPDPEFPFPFALAVGREMVPPVRYAMDRCESVWELICTLMAPHNVNHLPLRLLPTRLGVGTRRLVGARERTRLFGDGPLAVTDEIVAPAPPVEPTAQPAPQAGIDIKAWVKGRSWSDRVRLALPWRFGLLSRAMKDRW